MASRTSQCRQRDIEDAVPYIPIDDHMGQKPVGSGKKISAMHIRILNHNATYHYRGRPFGRPL